jgi:lysozyme
MLVQEEGEILHAYRDQLGYLTIGVGRLIDARKGGGISRGESRGLLMNDITRRTSVAQQYPWFAALDTVRQAVVVGMIFQLGEVGFAGFKNTIKDIVAGQFDSAATRMLQSRWAEQTPERAARMAAMMRTGEWVY